MGAADPEDMTFKRFQEIAVGRSQLRHDGGPSLGQNKGNYHGGKAKKDVGTEDGISDYRRLVEEYRQTEEKPESVKRLARSDRALCRAILRGFFGEYHLHLPPASAGWNPNGWSVVTTERFVDIIKSSPDLAHMEKWSDGMLFECAVGRGRASQGQRVHQEQRAPRSFSSGIRQVNSVSAAFISPLSSTLLVFLRLCRNHVCYLHT